jgi:hypothetical protein
MRKYAENAENLSRASPIVGNLESPSNFTNGGFGRHQPTAERQDQRFNRRVVMTVERAQINLRRRSLDHQSTEGTARRSPA